MRQTYRALVVSAGIGIMLLLGSTRRAVALDSEHTRATLRGLRVVEVVVEDIPKDAEADGRTTQQIQTDVELRLRKAGIRVLSKTESLKTPGDPALYIGVSTFKDTDLSFYAF